MGRLGIAVSIGVFVLTLSACAAKPSREGTPVIQRVSVASNGRQANGNSTRIMASLSISEDGRFVAFVSEASNLVAGDTNGCMDVFVHDCKTRQTTRVSVASDGTQGDRWSYAPVISADGRHVVFWSYASNLVPNDTNQRHDVFVHHLATGKTERVNVTSKGEQVTGEDMSMEIHDQLAISADGRYVAFATDALELKSTKQGWGEVYVHDCRSGKTEPVALTSDGKRANGVSLDPAISGDGRYVAFYSQATDLASGGSGTPYGGIFLHDRQSGETRCVTVGSDGKPADGETDRACISQDGRYVAFDSGATNLAGPEVQRLLALAAKNHGGRAGAVYVHDAKSGRTALLGDGDAAMPGLYSWFPSLSGDGRYVTFLSSRRTPQRDDAKPQAQHVFLYDRTTQQTVQVDFTRDGKPGNGSGVAASVSANGQPVAVCSGASNLVKGDTNGKYDVFVWSRKPAAKP